MTLAQRVEAAANRAKIIDLHTHLYAPQFGSLNLWGIDELLTYHYLVAETLRAARHVTPEGFFARSKREQADLVWQTLFVEQSPLSEATAGVLTVLAAFGLDPDAPNLDEARDFFGRQRFEEHIDHVFELAGVSQVAMTNDPCDPAERPVWEAGLDLDARFLPCLRLDQLIQQPDFADQLPRWIDRMQPRYVAISVESIPSFPPYLLETCERYRLPLALMVGVRRRVNPAIRDAGDGMSTVNLEPLEALARTYPSVDFLVTTLARANSHDLCVVARKFANVRPFGCWWFMNNPSLVEETTRMRLEMLGSTFVPQHSDARVLEQLIYKWSHSRRSIARALSRRYEDMGYSPSDAQIERDTQDLLGGIAAQWLA